MDQGLRGAGPLLVLLVDLLLAWLLVWLLAWLLAWMRLLLLLLEPLELLLVHDFVPQGPSSHVLRTQSHPAVRQFQGHHVCLHDLWLLMAQASNNPDDRKLVRAPQAAASQLLSLHLQACSGAPWLALRDRLSLAATSAWPNSLYRSTLSTQTWLLPIASTIPASVRPHLPLLVLVVVDAHDDQPSDYCHTGEHSGPFRL